jgi:hypothetical protein
MHSYKVARVVKTGFRAVSKYFFIVVSTRQMPDQHELTFK